MSDINKKNELRLPEGFAEENGRLYFCHEDDDKMKLVSSHLLEPVAKACNRAGNGNWHIILKCANHSGAEVEMIICMKKVKKSTDSVISQLAGKGIFVDDSKLFLMFLQRSCEMDLPVYRVAIRPGFQPEELVFQFGPYPIFVAGREGIQGVIPGEGMMVNDTLAVAGSLEQWQEQVARKVCGMAPKLAILVGLSSFLLPLLGESGAIFHLCGDSSTGKTAALQAGASVNGQAAEPGSGSPTQIQRWNATSNGLELLMVMNNGTTLALDELGSFTGKNFAETLYDIVSGATKSRMDPETLGMARQSTWVQNVLSTGELTIVDRIRLEKSQVMEGMLHRALSIPVMAEDSRSENESIDAARQRISDIKTSLLTCHGSAGYEFVRCLTHLADESGNYFDWKTTSDIMKSSLNEFHDEMNRRLHAGLTTLSSVESRALRRFAILFMTGAFAADWGILPWQCSDIADVTFEAFGRWLQHYRCDAGRKENIMIAVQNFIAVNRSKLIDTKMPSFASQKTDIAGYILDDGSYLLLPDTLDKLGNKWGLSAKNLARLVDEAGYLTRPEGDRLTARRTIRKVNVTGYCFSADFAKARL
ncbi:TPA: DUF927 domain-containing protein [Enterobacter hormaechei subsp. steigerwaltii]|nr:DUF927 domain-containing protein [Enterobacter hormaechei subsp. steigerwaltii]